MFDQIKGFIEDFKELEKLLKLLNGDKNDNMHRVGAQGYYEEAQYNFQTQASPIDISALRDEAFNGEVDTTALEELMIQFKEAGVDIESFGELYREVGYDMTKFDAALKNVNATLEAKQATPPEGIDMASLGGGQDVEEMADGIERVRDAQISLNEANQTGQAIQEGINTAKEIGTAITEAATAATEAGTVADTAGAMASQSKALADTSAAGAEAAKQNAKMGPFGWIAAIAAAAALIGTLFGLMKFEKGGIVGGTSTTGDRVLARVNSGEMILNKRQQSHLFKMINDGTVATGAGNLVGTVRVKGSDLDLALSNYGKVRGVNRNL